MIKSLHNNDKIRINLFGKVNEVSVFSADYRYDGDEENGLLSK